MSSSAMRNRCRDDGSRMSNGFDLDRGRRPEEIRAGRRSSRLSGTARSCRASARCRSSARARRAACRPGSRRRRPATVDSRDRRGSARGRRRRRRSSSRTTAREVDPPARVELGQPPPRVHGADRAIGQREAPIAGGVLRKGGRRLDVGGANEVVHRDLRSEGNAWPFTEDCQPSARSTQPGLIAESVRSRGRNRRRSGARASDSRHRRRSPAASHAPRSERGASALPATRSSGMGA